MGAAIPRPTLARKHTGGVAVTAPGGRKRAGWFGYKLHLLVDALYELPVAFAVTKASASDVKEGHALIDRLAKERPARVSRCAVLLADKAYDDTKLIVKLWEFPSRRTGGSSPRWRGPATNGRQPTKSARRWKE